MQQDFINLSVWTVEHWPQIVTYVSVALASSVTFQYFKRRTKIDQLPAVKFLKLIPVDGPRVVHFLSSLWTFIGALYLWLLSPTTFDMVPKQFAFLFVIVSFVHRFLVSPAGDSLAQKLKPYIDAVQQIKAAQLAAQSVAQPIASIAPEMAVPVEQPVQGQ